MKQITLVLIVSVISLTIIAIFAIVYTINHYLLTTISTLIGTITGYAIGKTR